MAERPAPETSLPDALTESGLHLRTLAEQAPMLLVFLRHWGCPFCRQTLSDLAQLRSAIDARGVQLVFVHMGTPDRGRPYFEHYGLTDIPRISDPGQVLYRDAMFALPKKHIFRHILDRAAVASFFRGIVIRHGIGLLFKEDAEQMPGAFLLRAGAIIRSYHYRSIADRPDWLAFIR